MFLPVKFGLLNTKKSTSPTTVNSDEHGNERTQVNLPRGSRQPPLKAAGAGRCSLGPSAGGAPVEVHMAKHQSGSMFESLTS